MAMDERSYSELLDLIYECAVDPQLWPRMMERLADSVGANGVALIDQHQENLEGSGLVARIDPAVVAPYFDHYAHLNPLLGRIPNLHERLRTWEPEIFTDEEVVPKAELMRTEYYTDFLRPQDFHSVLTIGLHLRGMNGVLLNLMRPQRNGQFQRAELDTLAELHPHLIRAYRMTIKLAGMRQAAGDFAEAIDRSLYGLVLTDAEGRIRRINSVAEQLGASGTGLLIQAGRLTAARSDEARRLEAMISAAASRDPARRSGGSIALTSPERHLPLSITVAPLGAQGPTIFDQGPSVLICITDLEAGVSLPEQRLIELFALTSGEAKVALALLEGGGPRDVAQSLGISFYTVRAHLVRIYAKTATSRQSELVRVMMRVIGADFAG